MHSMHILITGGAGYIGSFMVHRMLSDGHTVTVVDSLENGHKDAIDSRAQSIFGDLLDPAFVKTLFHNTRFDGVIHFAGYISMAESMQNPAKYFDNNVQASMNVLEEMKATETNNFIFSSTAGVYGNPVKVPIPEDHPTKPTNPYGESKLMVEHILTWYQQIFHINFAALRYFNASGAALDASLGERHDPETHIIPNAIKKLLKDEPFTLFGTDYKTPDGTCVRDYIHVMDLVEAHVLALQKLQKDPGGYIYNVGTGTGHSNQEIINAVEKVSGKKLNVEKADRRPGDADILVADASRIQQELGFAPKYSNIETIVQTAWDWHKQQG